jgi:hypothetical protein
MDEWSGLAIFTLRREGSAVAEIWGAVIVGAATIGSAAYSSRQAGRAANAQAHAGDAAIGEQRRQFDTLLNLTANERAIGNQALNALGSIYGYTPAVGYANDEYTGLTRTISREPMLVGDTELPPGTTTKEVGGGWYEVWHGGQRIGTLRPGGPNGRFINDTGADINALWKDWEDTQRIVAGGRSQGGTSGGNQLAGPDYSAFYQSPDYQFRLNQGLNAVQNSAAAQGGLYSGNALRGINEFAQGSAASEFGNYVNRQLALAGMGQAATTQAGNAAMTTGTNVGNLLLANGNARASGIIGQANAVTGGVNDLASLYGMYRGGYFNRGGGGYNIQSPDAWGALDSAMAGGP